MIRAHRSRWLPLALACLAVVPGSDLIRLPAAASVTAALSGASALDSGELLLGELNCIACHAAPEAVAARLQSRPAPRLGTNGLRLAPAWIRTWLADPSASKPGTLMPDVLHGVPEAERAQAIEALTQFLVSIQPPGPAAAVSADPARAESGARLYHSLGCVACHAPMTAGPANDAAFQSARTNAIPLGDLARKYPAGELVRFLQNPAAHRPSGRMPSLNLSEAEATDLAIYLLRDQLAAPATEAAPVAGLRWDYFEGRFPRCADLAQATPTASGVTDRIATGMVTREGSFGLRFTGGIVVPADGEYTFWSRSDDGSQVRVDDRVVVDNDGEHGAETRSGKIQLTAGYHSFQVLFCQLAGGFELRVQWAGPGIAREDIPASVLRHHARPMLPVGHAPLSLDPAQVSKGREWFSKLNCGACHGGDGLPAGETEGLPSLAAVAGRKSSGCLQAKGEAGDPSDAVRGSLRPIAPPSVPTPHFNLDASQRRQLRKTLGSVQDLTTPLDPKRQIQSTLSRLQCYACHARDGVGGPGATGHADWFALVGEADLGEEGRIPPALNGVGSKLKPEWMTEVLAKGSKVRPYMATRMPVFGAAAVATLPASFRATDRRPDAPDAPATTERDAKFGWKLVGNDGLACVACHTFGKYGSLGIPALGLDTMAHRLEWDWFRRYLPDPAALRPGTRMPTFWPEGQAVNDTILAGDTDAQIRALWAYLAAGAEADVPTGLIRGRQELVPSGEPMIYRNFIEGAGTRAIGVGYPEKANLAFDAAAMRLALIWQGSFMDGARHSTGRGEGFEPPLGDHRVALPSGPPFAVLPAPDSPWPTATGTAAGYRFLGYQFDAGRRPAFRYRFGDVTVEESIEPRPGDVDMTLVRTFRLSGTAPGPVWFRAASRDVAAGSDGGWILNKQLRMRLEGSGAPVLVQGELRVPVSVPGTFREELTW
ncbi:MAG: c-type cytochrome [Verrucomicrobia bacterium]|nr:c-type cytochrome [Verrucomicrobiota bacterium]